MKPPLLHQTLDYNSAFPYAPSNCQNDDQACDNKCTSNKGDNNNTASTCWKFAPDYVVLALEVAVKANEQDDDANADKCCSQWLTNVP
jgi:hypothetical protein